MDLDTRAAQDSRKPAKRIHAEQIVLGLLCPAFPCEMMTPVVAGAGSTLHDSYFPEQSWGCALIAPFTMLPRGTTEETVVKFVDGNFTRAFGQVWD